MGLNRSIFDEINAADENNLGRLEQFAGTGDQDESNDRARAAIAARRAAFEAERRNKAQQEQTQKFTANAKQFREGLPEYQNRAYNQVADVARRNLAQSMAGVKQNYNNRGLLYSGLKQGQEASNYAQTAAGLSQARAGINQGSEQSARDMEQRALAGEFKSAEDMQAQQAIQMERQNELYNEALKNVMERLQMFGAIGGAAGAVGGGLMGRAGRRG